jgi:hypothetical protein
VSEFDIPPPLDADARALLERAKGTEPAPAPSDVRARARARLEGTLRGEGSDAAGEDDPATSRSRLASGLRFPPVGRMTGIGRRLWQAAPWIAAVAAFAVIGLRARRHAADRASMRADRPETIVPTVLCNGDVSLDDDPANCGRCGHDCCGGSCEHGVCQAVVVAQGYHPGRPAVDATHVYWPDGRDTLGRIMKAPKRGGAPPVALASGQRRPWEVAVHGDYVYWVTNSDAAPTYGGVFKAPKGGGDVVAIVASGEAFANGLTVNDSGIYWDDYGEYTPAEHSGQTDDCAPGARIRKVGLDGTDPTTLASPETGVCTPLLMAVGARAAYWPSRFGHTIQSVGLGGGAAVTIAATSDPVAVAVDAAYVYWANWKDGTVQRAPLGGGAAATIATSGTDLGPNEGVGASDLAVDATNVYWSREGPPWGSSGAILYAPVSGAPVDVGSVLATSPSADLLTTDSACVYWVDAADGKIRAVAKP